MYISPGCNTVSSMIQEEHGSAGKCLFDTSSRKTSCRKKVKTCISGINLIYFLYFLLVQKQDHIASKI